MANRFAVLEEQMCAMAQDGYTGKGSPDRLDAAVHGLTEIMLSGGTVQMFPDFRPARRELDPANACHVVSAPQLKEWWPRWISASVGAASSAHWWCREPNGRSTVYREYLALDMTPEEFGMGIALRSKEESASLRMVPVWMSEKAFDRTNGKSIAHSMAEGINRSVGANKAFMFVHNDRERDHADPVKRTRAIQNRIDAMPNGFLSVQALRGGKDQTGWDVVREMLRWRPNSHEARPESPDWDYARALADDVAKFHEYMRQFATAPTEVLPVLVISQECKALIQAMSGAVRSEKDDSALQNSGTGFVLQSLRIGALASREDQGVEPMAEFVGRRMDNMPSDANPISKFLAASKAEDDWDNLYAPAPVTFARVARPGR